MISYHVSAILSLICNLKALNMIQTYIFVKCYKTQEPHNKHVDFTNIKHYFNINGVVNLLHTMTLSAK